METATPDSRSAEKIKKDNSSSKEKEKRLFVASIPGSRAMGNAERARDFSCARASRLVSQRRKLAEESV